MPLSDIQVRNLKSRDKAYKVSDFEGLFVLVKVNGSKLWQFKYRLFGKERLLSIGVYPDVSLAQARKAKEDARAKVAAGIDPSEAKQTERRAKQDEAAQTFELIGAMFFGFVAQIGLRPISPLPQTDLAYSHGTWYAKRCEAV